MTLVDEIKTKYMLYEVEVVPGSRDETVKALDVFIDDMNETIDSSRKAIQENFRDEQLTKIKNFFLDLFGYEEEDVEHFGRDTGIVLRHSCLAERYLNYFSKLQSIASDDNCGDVCKLAMFTYDSYFDNYQYLQSLRSGIRLATEGITFYGNGEDSQQAFGEFFEKTFENMLSKGKQYKK